MTTQAYLGIVLVAIVFFVNEQYSIEIDEILTIKRWKHRDVQLHSTSEHARIRSIRLIRNAFFNIDLLLDVTYICVF